MKIIAANKYIVLLFLITFSIANAQENPKVFGRTILEAPNPENGLIRCVSTEYEKYLKEQNPAIQKNSDFEEIMAQKIQLVKAQRQASPQNTTEVITIPVVVHVVHNGDPIGTNENIFDAQVLSQITVLNQDFRRMMGTPGFNDNPVGADVEIEFCLATIDPDGNPTNGIDRFESNIASYDTNDVQTAKQFTIWNPSQYFNIWVFNFGGDLDDVLGYAQFPNLSGLDGLDSNNGTSQTDGVAIAYQYFGSSAIYPQGNYQAPYNRGRTTTHEIGHAFGLRHIWGDANNCSVDDFCDDTPRSQSANGGCPTQDTCPTYPGLDMVENYMDYTNDACMNIFTQDQKDRMMVVLQNSPRRASLTFSTVCGTTAGNEDFELLNGINVYPNPTSTVLNIAVANGELPDSYTIYNSLGQTVANVNVSSDANLAVNTSSYSNGIYFIKINKGSTTKTLKFIKN